MLQGEIYDLTGRYAPAPRRRVARALRSGRGGQRGGRAHVFGRHAATSSTSPWVCSTRRRSCSWTSRRRASTPRLAPTCGRTIARLAREERMTDPADHALPRGGGRAWRRRLAIVDRGRIVASGTPEELKSGLRGDAARRSSSPASDGDVRSAISPHPGRPGAGRSTAVALRARADDGATALPALPRGAPRRPGSLGAPSVSVSRPSLDDVYLRYAGRAFQDADSEIRKEECSMRALRHSWHITLRYLRAIASGSRPWVSRSPSSSR